MRDAAGWLVDWLVGLLGLFYFSLCVCVLRSRRRRSAGTRVTSMLHEAERGGRIRSNMLGFWFFCSFCLCFYSQYRSDPAGGAVTKLVATKRNPKRWMETKEEGEEEEEVEEEEEEEEKEEEEKEGNKKRNRKKKRKKKKRRKRNQRA